MIIIIKLKLKNSSLKRMATNAIEYFKFLLGEIKISKFIFHVVVVILIFLFTKYVWHFLGWRLETLKLKYFV